MTSAVDVAPVEGWYLRRGAVGPFEVWEARDWPRGNAVGCVVDPGGYCAMERRDGSGQVLDDLATCWRIAAAWNA